MTKSVRIIFSGGGTLGSVTPLLAMAARVRERDSRIQIWWCGTFRGPERRIAVTACHRYIPLSNGKWRRYFSLLNLIDPFLIIIGFFQSLTLLLLARPRAVVSGGGFVAVPLVWAAWVLRIPRIIVQLDVATSLATTLTFPLADKRLYVFPPRHPFLPHAPQEALIRFPVRQFLRAVPQDREALAARAVPQFRLRPRLPTIAAIGGGTGSQALNDALISALPGLLALANVIHITGARRAAPSPLPVTGEGYFSAAFLGQELALALGAATLAITRGGIGTLAELSAAGVVPIIVPLPGSPQEENAQYLVAQGAAVVVEQSPALGEACLETVRKLLQDRGSLEIMRARLYAAIPVDDGTEGADILLGSISL